MSTFEVKVRQIDVLEPHPNADRLECVVIGGYRAVVAKGVHKVGDMILYVPEDTVFLDRTIAEKLKVADYLTGKYKNRVKAVRLRGLLSQGIVLPLSAFDGQFPNVPDPEFDAAFADASKFWVPAFQYEGEWLVTCSEDIMSILKLEKYEEPIPIEMMGHVRPWPTFLPHYDVENVKRPESLAAVIDGEEIVFTEKLHGTNMAVAIGPGLEVGEEAYVCSRRMAIKESDTNVYWRAAKKFDLINKLRQYFKNVDDNLAVQSLPPVVSLHGEVVGVQDLKYGFVNGDIGFFAFDIMVNGEYLDYDVFADICDSLDIPRVPELYRGPYNYDALNKAAHGKTVIGEVHIREGGVFRPIKERRDIVGNRVQFKFISEDYLTRKGGTEMN